MGGMALVVLGMFVLVWIISAVVKATQNPGQKPNAPANRARAAADAPRVEKTSNTDIDRFMAEIDRLRRKGEGAPAGPARAPEPARSSGPPRLPRSTKAPKPEAPKKTAREKEREREKESDREKERAADRESDRRRRLPGTSAKPDPVPVLRPVPSDMASPAISPTAPARNNVPTRPATTTATTTSVPASAVLQTVHSILKTKQGPAAALILAEIFGEPRSRKPAKPYGS